MGRRRKTRGGRKRTVQKRHSDHLSESAVPPGRREFLALSGKVILFGGVVTSIGSAAFASERDGGNRTWCDANNPNICTQSTNTCDVKNVCSGEAANSCGPGAANVCTELNACTGATWANVCSGGGLQAGNQCGTVEGGTNICNSLYDAVNYCKTGGESSEPGNQCVGPGSDGYAANACGFKESISANTCDIDQNWCSVDAQGIVVGNVAFKIGQKSCHPEMDV